MNAMEQYSAINPNPVLSVAVDGTVLYSNEASEPLLHECGIRVGEKLPAHIGDIVYRVFFRKIPENIEVKVGEKDYRVTFYPSPDDKCINIYGFEKSDYVEIETKLCKADEQIQTQSEELSLSNKYLRVQSDEHNEVNALLHDSTIGFLTLAENSPDFITRFDRQDRCIYANPAVKRSDIPLIVEFYAWYVNRFFDKTNSKVGINPEMMKLSEKQRKNAFASGKSEAMVFHYVSPKGKKYWFETKVIPEFSNNEVVFIFVISSDITNVKEAEATLKSSNLYNRSLIEASLDPLVIIGNDGNVTDVNKATEQATGYSRNYLIGTYFAQYLTEPDHAISAFLHVCTHGEIRDFALEIKHKDGHRTPVLCNASVYRDENGKVIGVFVAARDITERKKAEEVLKGSRDILEDKVKERTIELEKANKLLKESEERLIEAQKIVHIGSWDWNPVTNKLDWTEELYHILGLDPQVFVPSYEVFISHVHPDDREYLNDAVKEALNGRPLDTDYRMILADGAERIVHVQGGAIFDEENNPIRMRGTVQDITERKRVEEKLRESEEKYRSIVETANEGILITDKESIITYVNKKFADMLRYNIEEIIGRPIWGFISEEFRPIVELNLEKRQQGISDSYELKSIRKDGSSLWVLLNAKPLFDKDGKYMGAMSMLTDLTKRKEAEDALAKIEIARKQEIHHRIKNNLQVISSLLDLQADKIKQKENITKSEVLEAFRESQSRVLSMALIHEELHKNGENDILDFPSYIDELAENLFLTYRLGNEGISLDMDIEEDIFFDMDTSVPLGIIINELVSNSLKHAFSDRDKGEIRIKIHREECKIEDSKSTTFFLSISDNGVGIPEDFDFENLDSLGMKLVITLVDQLDGELELKRNNGTEFTIRFTVSDRAPATQ